MTDPDWIQLYQPRPGARTRLICCPHAGASASAFTQLATALPATLEAISIQYPGRRGGDERGFTDIGELADRVAGHVVPLLDRPVAVLGHSMGSVVAFELTRRLADAGADLVRLFVSGRAAPSAGLGLRPPGDEQIVAELRSLGGIPDRLLDKPKFRESIVSVIRADYRANAAYLAPPSARVPCPITFLLAEDDGYVSKEAAGNWRQHTAGEFDVLSFPGGHFFINERLAEIAAAIDAGTGASRH